MALSLTLCLAQKKNVKGSQRRGDTEGRVRKSVDIFSINGYPIRKVKKVLILRLKPKKRTFQDSYIEKLFITFVPEISDSFCNPAVRFLQCIFRRSKV